MRSPARSPAAGKTGRPFDRHSGTGLRGLPKKGGAGGKGVWGAAGEQEGVVYLDKNDPNYDSDNEKDEMPPNLNLSAPTAPEASPSTSNDTNAAAQPAPPTTQ